MNFNNLPIDLLKIIAHNFNSMEHKKKYNKVLKDINNIDYKIKNKASIRIVRAKQYINIHRRPLNVDDDTDDEDFDEEAYHTFPNKWQWAKNNRTESELWSPHSDPDELRIIVNDLWEIGWVLGKWHYNKKEGLFKSDIGFGWCG